MTPSFTLGFEQVRDELMLMQPAGCYWLTANREEDARFLVRQCISAQRSVALISAGCAPHALLTPEQTDGPDALPLFSLPETWQALLNFPNHLITLSPDNPRLVIFFNYATLWENRDREELRLWAKAVQHQLAGRAVSLLIVTCGPTVNTLRPALQTFYRHLDGLAHLDGQPESWHYRISWWANDGRMLTDYRLRLTQQQQRFALVEQDETLTPNDEQLYLAEKTLLEGASPLSGQWTLFDDNAGVYQQALQAHAATVVFSLQHNGEISELAAQIHSLRRTRGSDLKIVVRERQTTLRFSDERLLLACGVNAILPYSASLPRLFATLESLQGQSYHRHVPADLPALMKSIQPLQARGYLPPSSFCQSVTLLMNNPLLPENGKGLLVALRSVSELKPEQVLTLCQPRRYGDLITLADGRLYLFLSSCRFSDLDTALKFIFRQPYDEIFTDRRVWHEDGQIVAEIREIADRASAARPAAPAGEPEAADEVKGRAAASDNSGEQISAAELHHQPHTTPQAKAPPDRS